METVREKAYAKVNLGLDVVRRREDGYHEVNMIMQNIGIFDVLTFEKREKGITLKIDRQDLPTDGNNLVYRTAKLIMDECHISDGVLITLKKSIPVAAGLAGGSADAAACFRGLNRLFSLNLSEEHMREMAVKIGADVPYCLMGGTALAQGIGEQLTPLPEAPAAVLLVAKPDIQVSTKYVYEYLNLSTLKVHPDIDEMIQSISRNDLRGMVERMENVLESVTVEKYPVIDQIKSHMKDQGALNALMSGSGPTVFGIFEKQETAAAAYMELKKTNLAKEIFVTTFVNPRWEEV